MDDIVFSAKMVCDNPLNSERKFNIRFGLQSDWVKIWEIATPGFREGFFYKSQYEREKKKPRFDNIHLGAELCINGVKFLLIDAPEPTLSLMESMPNLFPSSDLFLISEKLSAEIKKEAVLEIFTKHDISGCGRIPIGQAKKIIIENTKSLNQQEIETILRRYRFFSTQLFCYSDFISLF